MRRRAFVAGMAAAVVAAPKGVAVPLAAEPPRLYTVGVILHGGSYLSALEGLRDGLKELGLEEGRHLTLHVRDTKGDLTAVEGVARVLEMESVDLIYTLATSVTLAATRATKMVPIVFYTGSDPVAAGLVQSFRKPGGRFTGVHGRFTDLAAKRLQLLKEMIPTLRRVVTFYNPGNPAARETIREGRAAARRLNVELVERLVASVHDLRVGLGTLQPREVDAFFYVADAMMTGQADLVIEVARTKNLPTMFADKETVVRGALASYGVSYYMVGRLSAKHIQRILNGIQPADLPVEQIDTPHLAINLKTARALNLTIPPSLLLRADQVIE